MIDPVNITNFDQTTEQLEENLLFWVCAAGKNAISAANGLERFMKEIHSFYEKEYKPFKSICQLHYLEVPGILKRCGIGCYNQKAETFWQLAKSDLDLKTCSVDDLEKIKGIGCKTSRCFVLHSRKNANHAGLDVHILNFIRDQGYDVPKSTPNKKEYLRIEAIFLDLAKRANMSVADYDLSIWKQYFGR